MPFATTLRAAGALGLTLAAAAGLAAQQRPAPRATPAPAAALRSAPISNVRY